VYTSLIPRFASGPLHVQAGLSSLTPWYQAGHFQPVRWLSKPQLVLPWPWSHGPDTERSGGWRGWPKFQSVLYVLGQSSK